MPPPASLSASEVEATAFTLSWSLPESIGDQIELVTGFYLYCLNGAENMVLEESVNGSSILTYRVTGLEEFTGYTCCVAAVSFGRNGEERCVEVATQSAGK